MVLPRILQGFLHGMHGSNVMPQLPAGLAADAYIIARIFWRVDSLSQRQSVHSQARLCTVIHCWYRENIPSAAAAFSHHFMRRQRLPCSHTGDSKY